MSWAFEKGYLVSAALGSRPERTVSRWLAFCDSCGRTQTTEWRRTPAGWAAAGDGRYHTCAACLDAQRGARRVTVRVSPDGTGRLGFVAVDPTADEAAEMQQAQLVQLVTDLQQARRRSESTEEQARYLQERYWIVPKGQPRQA